LSNEWDFPDYIKINKLLHVTLTKKEKTRNEYPPTLKWFFPLRWNTSNSNSLYIAL